MIQKKDDPIYKGGFVINSLRKIKSNNKEKKMGKFTKITFARTPAQLTQLKATGYSIIFAKNLKTSIEKDSNHKEMNNIKKSEGKR